MKLQQLSLFLFGGLLCAAAALLETVARAAQGGASNPSGRRTGS